MNITDDILMAYVDGELDPGAVAAVEQAMRDDPQVAAAVAAQRALREQLRRAFAPVMDEPVPARLRDAALATRAKDAPNDSATVASLDAARGRQGRRPADTPALAGRPARRARRWPTLAALAASLALGVLVAPWLRPDGPAELIDVGAGGLVAQGALAAALDARLASSTGDAAVDVGFSFRDRDGRYCRTFVVESRALAGLACRGDGGWRVTATGASEPAGGDLRLASSPLPPSVLAEVDARIDGEPLDAAAERAARDAGWR